MANKRTGIFTWVLAGGSPPPVRNLSSLPWGAMIRDAIKQLCQQYRVLYLITVVKETYRPRTRTI